MSTAVGGVAALAALWIMRPKMTSRFRSFPIVVLPVFALAIAHLRRGPLGETAVQLGLALSLATVLMFAAIARWRGESALGNWGIAGALITLWWLLCTPRKARPGAGRRRAGRVCPHGPTDDTDGSRARARRDGPGFLAVGTDRTF